MLAGVRLSIVHSHKGLGEFAVNPEQLQRLQDAAIAAATPDLTPHPAGIVGRIADAHAQAAQAIAAGDIDGAIGAEPLAAALTARR